MNKTARVLLLALGAIIAAILITAGIKYALDRSQEKAQIITQVDPNLSAEAKKLYEQRRDDAKKLVSEINDQTSADEKFNRYIALANAEFSLGNYSESKKWFLEALAVNPKHEGIWHTYSSLLAAMKDYRGALGAVDKAISLKADNSDYWKWKIELLKKYDYDNEEINDLYTEALQKTDNSINIITAYAVFLEEIGDLQGAKSYWEKAIDVNGANRSQYQAEIARLEKLIK
jgi:tetratricopeptide (TPR) repeat protein